MTPLGWSVFAVVVVAPVVIAIVEIISRRAWRKRMEQLKRRAKR